MKPYQVKIVLLSGLIAGLPYGALAKDLPKEFVDKEGNITLATDFRTSTTHLGSWLVPSGDASGFHGVYASEGTLEHYRNTGEFPNGAVIIKELRVADSGDFTTGQGVSYESGQIKQWFVMVKDGKNRFADNPLWGDGWGWALFKPDNPTKNVATNYKNDCLSCHMPAKDTDWVYTQGYPVLKK
ncbi:cytochrome P460 family protein [Pseudoalteromonas sp. T1lg76]|uniref:cytochrome P460 family protein n=1 Tax=Pseudoalteromonas sp. T1lg76 TaxID=2077103 RepID=UPI000CF6EA53|nr:cytochrome P460 family protein [Pseudoalteromonas sp. T1lg76]